MLTIDPRAEASIRLYKSGFYFVLNIPCRRAICQGIKSLHIFAAGRLVFRPKHLEKNSQIVYPYKSMGKLCLYVKENLTEI